MSRALDVTTEPLDGDRVRCTWTDPDRRQVCEAVYTLDQLAAMQRGEVVSDLPAIERTDLDAAIAALEARQEGVEARQRQLRREHPGIDGEGSA